MKKKTVEFPVYSIDRFKSVYKKKSQRSSLVVIIGGICCSLVAVMGAVGLIVLSGDNSHDLSKSVVARSISSPAIFSKGLIVERRNAPTIIYDLQDPATSAVYSLWPDDNNCRFELYDSFDSNATIETIARHRNVSEIAPADAENYNSRLARIVKKWRMKKYALDRASWNLYGIDESADRLEVLNVKSQNRSVVLKDLIRPMDLRLDSFLGIIFVQQRRQIIKASMAGKSPRVIVASKNEEISAMAVDRRKERIYWSTNDTVLSADYDGTDVKSVTKTRTPVVSLTISEDKLFWIQRSDDDHKDGRNEVWYCELSSNDGRVCSSRHRMDEAVDALSIHAYDLDKKTISTNSQIELDNCKNADCEHLCVLDSSNRYSCACDVGRQLGDDLKTCRSIDLCVVYLQGNKVKGRACDNSTEGRFAEAMDPLRIEPRSAGIFNPVINFDVDASRNFLLYADDSFVYELPLSLSSSSGSEKKILLSSNRTDRLINGFTFDWVAKNLYYSRIDDTGNGYAMFAKNLRRDSAASEGKRLFEFGMHLRPRVMVVHPSRGCLFFSTEETRPGRPETTADIVRMNLDGSGKRSFLTRFAAQNATVDPKALALDHEEDRIYWFDRSKTKIHYSTIVENATNETELGTIDVGSTVSNPVSMAVKNNWLFVSNLTSLWRLSKIDGFGGVKVAPEIDYDNEAGVILGVSVTNSLWGKAEN